MRYRDAATADPPNRTLTSLRPESIVVWAVTYESSFMPPRPIRLDLDRARHLACCEGAEVPSGVYELTGAGPRRAYSVIVRIYFGSRPSPRRLEDAQRALDRLRLPPPR